MRALVRDFSAKVERTHVLKDTVEATQRNCHSPRRARSDRISTWKDHSSAGNGAVKALRQVVPS